MFQSLGKYRFPAAATLACAASFALAASAHAAGASKVLVLPASDNATDALAAQLRPRFGSVTVGGGDLTTASLSGFDAVVIGRDYAWVDQNAVGDALADFEDAGGVVIASSASFRSGTTEPGQAILGRWSTGGYAPLLPDLLGPTFSAQAPFIDDNLGQNPVLMSIGQLNNTAASPAPHLAPGAIPLLRWLGGDERVAVAIKGRAVAINGLFGDSYLGESTAYGRLIANAIWALSDHAVAVQIRGRGVVTSQPSGFDCSSSCTGGSFAPDSLVRLHAQPRKGSAFVGWSRACSGLADCSVTTGYPGLDPAKWHTPPVRATFVDGTVTGFKVRSGRVSVLLPRAGKLVVSGRGVRKLTKTVKGSGRSALALKRTGRARKVKLTFKFTPSGAAIGVETKRTLTF